MVSYYTFLDWDRFVERCSPLLKEYYNKELDFVKNLSGDVLEIGCGTGRILTILAKKCRRVVGIDKEKVMADISKNKLKKRRNVEICKQNAKRLKFPDNSFDFVLCMASTFGNLGRDKLPVLKEMKRVCKLNGKVIISVYNERALKPRLDSYANDELIHVKVTKQGTVYTKEGLFSEQFTKKKLISLFKRLKLKYKIISLNKISYLCTCSIPSLSLSNR